MDLELNVGKKPANIRNQRVKFEESYVPPLEDEGLGIQNLLAESKIDLLPVDDAFCFGILDTNGTQGQDDLGFGVLDGFLDGVDEVDDIYAANDISEACEDFILDDELVEKVTVLDGVSHCKTHMGNSSSESQSPGFSGSSNGALGLSESSTVTINESERLNVYHQERVICELNGLSRQKWKSKELEEHNISPKSRASESRTDMRPLKSEMVSDYEKKAVQLARCVAIKREKRMHKPTKRYIEEFSDYKSKQSMDTGKNLSVASRDKRPMIICQNKNNYVEELTLPLKELQNSNIIEAESNDSEELPDATLTCKQKAAASKDRQLKNGPYNGFHHQNPITPATRNHAVGNNSQASSEFRPRRGRPKKTALSLIIKSDDEDSASELEEAHVKRKKSKKRDDRRKHQRMWTLVEVMKLIDGIAQYGTGRWTDIKKLLFSSSAYRTPVDLRDKWRNLLRASCVHKQKQNKKDVEQKLKHAVRPLPKTVIRRIRELASLHPYPRFTPGGRYTCSKS